MKTIITWYAKHKTIADILLIILLTVPSWITLVNNQYFSMHDDQHIVRLYLFHKAIVEGNMYPRWVDGLGFGYGYPLFNFYPPLIYFVAVLFHFAGFSLIWSIKLMVITGFIGAAIGMYLFTKRIFGRWPAVMSSVLYTYFFYHAVTAFVRGAFAEFFALTVLPFVFLTMNMLFQERNLRNVALFGLSIGLLMINHPLVAFPSVFYIGAFFIFYLFTTPAKERIEYAFKTIGGGVLGLALSAFFWVPSIIEKQYTYVDEILTTELASYNIHFVYLQQLWQSNWAYGGSIEGPFDGMTFQLGKIHIMLALVSIAGFALVWFVGKKLTRELQYYLFFAGLLLFSIFMTTEFSKPVWDSISFLSYLQFPWRFMTFICVFISLTDAFVFYAIGKIQANMVIKPFKKYAHYIHVVVAICVFATSLVTIGVYGKYFRPQEYRNVTDADLTTQQEVEWRISRTSFEFVPKGVKTAKSELNTTILDITPETLPQGSYEILDGVAEVDELTDTARVNAFRINAQTPVIFQANTFNFPGWTAYSPELKQNFAITDTNDRKLATVELPQGEYTLRFEFKDTPVRVISNIITIVSLLVTAYLIAARVKPFSHPK